TASLAPISHRPQRDVGDDKAVVGGLPVALLRHHCLILVAALLLCGIGGSRAAEVAVPPVGARAQPPLSPPPIDPGEGIGGALTIDPGEVIGGAQAATATVTLTAPAPAGGAVVSLRSSDGGVGVPESVTVREGASGARAMVTTAAVTSAQSVTATAAYGGVT